MSRTANVKTIVLGILFLFFLQALSDFIQSIYAFGLLVTAFTAEIASVILLFTPVLFLFFRKPLPRSALIGLTYVAILNRLVEPMLAPGGRLVATGVSVGAFMLLFPALLANGRPVRGWHVVSGLTIALSLSIFLRTANSSLDLSESGYFQVIAWLLAAIAGALIWRMDLTPVEAQPAKETSSNGRMIGLCIGLASVILLIYFAFVSPAVIARWTGFYYAGIVAVLVVALFLFALLFGSDAFAQRLTRRLVLGWNALFVLTLVLTILPHQIAFPAAPSAYPLEAPPLSPLAAVPLFLALILSPVLLVDFMLFVRQISAERPSIRQLGGGFALAATFLLVMVFLHVFTTIYDYAPVVGPLFRNRFWLVYLLAGLGLSLPVLLLSRENFKLGKPEVAIPLTAGVVGILAVFSVGALFLTRPMPTAPPPTGQFKVMTYNIQQGFDEMGNANLEGQLAVVRAVDPDILGLQESDTARIANGNLDAVRYFTDNLDMHSYYGPSTTVGTFGIALLSKYAIDNASTFYMFSEGEQTATIQAQITVSGKPYQVFVTHLGNGGPMVQLEDMLAHIDDLDRVIAMGDYNFRPSSDQYALMTQTLADSWRLKWPDQKENPGYPPEEQIDHIFVSSGTEVVDSEYVVNPASDHPYLYTIIEP
jgi:endonuclease/exonuclease/phosphatase family metal-dependent hydrolase